MRKKPKILTIFGTRPEAIKLAPVVKRLEASTKRFVSIVCATAQHREMLDGVLRTFDIKPKYDLNVMDRNQTLFDLTANVLLGLHKIIIKEKPSLVLVQGDTTTAFAAALAAYYLKIPVGHVEAGLRTGDKYSPFPEEGNRRLISSIAELHFAPTARAKARLLREGCPAKKIFVTGNTVIDALLMTAQKLRQPGAEKKWSRYFHDKLGVMPADRRLILITGHRRESFGKDLENICRAIKKIAERNSNTVLIYPVHLNPNVRKPVKKILGGVKNIHLTEPFDYEPFVYLMSRAHIILTDSGGIQEEAPSLGKPVLVMRKLTERPEAIEAGTSMLVGADPRKIIREAERLLNDHGRYSRISRIHNPYGDGRASERIVGILGRTSMK